MATNSISQPKTGQHDHAECPRCAALEESNADLLAALRTARQIIGDFLGDEDTEYDSELDELLTQIQIAIARAEGR